MGKDIITGLVFGRDMLEWTTIQRNKGGLEKTGSGEMPVVDGEINGECRDLNGGIACSVASDQVLMRVIELPDVEPDELRSMVELQVDKFSPFPIENMVVSYEVLEKREANCLVLTAAVKTDVIDDIGDKLKGSGLEAERIDVDIMGWLRLLRDEGRIQAEGRQVVIVINAAPAIVVLQDGAPIVFRSLSAEEDMSRDDLLMEIAGEVGYTIMSLELEHGVAESISIEVYSDDDVSVDFIEELKQECGCDAQVESLNKLPSLSEGLARRSADEDRGMLDMTPLSWRLAETSRQSRKKVISIAVSLAAVWILMVAGFSGYIFYQEKMLEGLLAEQVHWKAPADEVREMASRIRIIRQYMERSDSALECLREITTLLPVSGIELSRFNYKKGESLVLSGEASARSIVVEFHENLNKSKIFAQVVPGDIKFLRGKYKFSFVLYFPGGEK